MDASDERVWAGLPASRWIGARGAVKSAAAARPAAISRRPQAEEKSLPLDGEHGPIRWGDTASPHRSPRSCVRRRWRRPDWIRSLAPPRRRRHFKPDAAGEASRDVASQVIPAGLIAYAAARIGASSRASLAVAAAWYFGSSSMPTYRRPARNAASHVEPEPANGSSTMPQGGQKASISGCRALTGF